jgi:hypothetical protein
VSPSTGGRPSVFEAGGGELPLFHGPVSALDDGYLTFAAAMSYANAGTATSGPYDAG